MKGKWLLFLELLRIPRLVFYIMAAQINLRTNTYWYFKCCLLGLLPTLISFVFLGTFPDTLLYPYGPQYQDRSTPKADDGASPEISISEYFYFYGRKYHSLYVSSILQMSPTKLLLSMAWPYHGPLLSSLQVNNNGVVSFGNPVSQFTPDPFPLMDGRAFVAPFWADVDNRIAGEVYYRQSQDQGLLRRVTADVNAYFPHEKFTATWAFVATWDQVAFYGSLSTKVGWFNWTWTRELFTQKSFDGHHKNIYFSKRQ